MNQHCYDLAIRVLLSREGRNFVAHALELDLVASGATEKAAMKELHETMISQLWFAAQMEKPEMVSHPAPRTFFKRWDEANKLALLGLVSKDKAGTVKAKAVCSKITPQELRAIRAHKGGGFKRISESELAPT
jgi:hypothetical protein